ncbi:hypothetical protein Tco_0271902 [Tanacetum coccineum]
MRVVLISWANDRSSTNTVDIVAQEHMLFMVKLDEHEEYVQTYNFLWTHQPDKECYYQWLVESVMKFQPVISYAPVLASCCAGTGYSLKDKNEAKPEQGFEKSVKNRSQSEDEVKFNPGIRRWKEH